MSTESGEMVDQSREQELPPDIENTNSNTNSNDVQKQMLLALNNLQHSNMEMATAFNNLNSNLLQNTKRVSSQPQNNEGNSKRRKRSTSSAHQSTSSAHQSTLSANQSTLSANPSTSSANQVSFSNDVELMAEEQPRFVDPEIENLLNTSPTYSFSDQENEGDEIDNSTLLKTISENLEDLQKCGPEIDPEIAAIINKRWFTTMTKDVLNTKLDTYLKPKNCENVKVPLVNGEIWKHLPKRAQRNDNTWLNLQRVVLATTAAVAEAVDNVYKASMKKEKLNYSKVITNLTESEAMLGHISYELNMKRKFSMRPFIKDEYKALCREPCDTTSDHLFGDDLVKSLKEVKEKNVVEELFQPQVFHQHNPQDFYQRGRGSHYNTRSRNYPRGRHNGGPRRHRRARRPGRRYSNW